MIDVRRFARRIRSLAALIAPALVLTPLAALSAQIDPSHRWLTISTAHFYVHFTAPVEPLARRIAADAERAYDELSRELHPPRGKIDVVLSDDVDFSNGSATPYPTNRIIVYANPPVNESALRYTNDWAQLVITHELTHIFHLDRTRGLWSIGQKIFGRAALLFPNSYDPSWLTEGLAVYEESKLAGAGRIEGSEHRMIARAAAIDRTYQSLGELSLGQGRYPFGESAYAFGSLFVDYLARTQGDSSIRKFVDKSAANIIPYLIDIPAKQGLGITFTRAWKRYTDSVSQSIAPQPAGDTWQQLTRSGPYAFDPRWLGDSAILYSGGPGRRTFGAYRVNLAGKETRIGRRNGQSPNVPLADGGVLYSQLDFVDPYSERSDLWIQHGRHEQQLTVGQRLMNPDARADGEIVAVQVTPGATRLVRVSRDGKKITPITTGTYDAQWTEPRWSHRGDRIAAIRWLRGNLSQIVILDSAGRELRIVASDHSIQATPSWAIDDSGIFYSSDANGTAQAFFTSLTKVTLANGRVAENFLVDPTRTGRFEPEPSTRADHLASTLFRSDGYHLGVSPCCVPTSSGWLPVDPPRVLTTASTSTAPIVVDSSAARPYSAWRTFYPRYWLPTVDPGIDGGYRIGATTSGGDVVGRHAMNATLEFPTNKTGVTGNFTYQYFGFGMPVLQFDAAQDWQSLGGIFSRVPPRPVVGELFRRTLTGDLLASWTRRRVRTSMSATVGAALEYRTHRATPSSDLIASIDTTGAYGTITYPTAIASVAFANYQRPPFSISPEDGISFGATVRDRTRSGPTGVGGQSVSTVGTVSMYKSLDLPGFAHHVLALRGAGGYTDNKAAGYFFVGGINGRPFEIVPGYVIGEGGETFPVRGFQPGTLVGIRAYTGSAEYRVPLWLVGRGPGDLPLFVDRASLSFFGDYGTAWCPSIATGREVCNRFGQSVRADIASIGAELNVNLGLLSWDSPYRFRLGYVHPTRDGTYFGRREHQIYFATGVSF